MPKPLILSGVQPTSSRLHLGNYLGALKNFVDLQESERYQCLFCVVDLHSLTDEYDPKQKASQILGVTAEFLAAGLDPKRSIIFQQSQVRAHTELSWIFSTITPLGELERMTQFKDKSARQVENINAGILMYPVLQAADILLYSPKFVPVGDDQTQHLELTRTIARKFNSHFGKTFPEPQILLTHAPRVMSLKNPLKKMSKSELEGCIFLDDAPDAVEAKIKRAVTDSGSTIFYDPEAKPAISNLLDIYAGVSEKPVAEVQAMFENKNYGEFKAALATLIIDTFASFRARKAALIKDRTKLATLLTQGSRKAAKIADQKMLEVRKKLGLVI